MSTRFQIPEIKEEEGVQRLEGGECERRV